MARGLRLHFCRGHPLRCIPIWYWEQSKRRSARSAYPWVRARRWRAENLYASNRLSTASRPSLRISEVNIRGLSFVCFLI